MKSPQLQLQVKQAWALRSNQRIEEALGLLAQIKQELGLEYLEELSNDRLKELSERVDFEVLAEVILLSGSFHRFQGDLKKYQDIVKILLEFQRSRNELPNFRLYFEDAINGFVLGDYSVALEKFMAAAQVASCSTDKAMALLNAVFCMENCGISFQATLAEVRELVSHLSNGSETQTIRQQLALFDERQWFSTGEFGKLFSAKPLDETAPWDQNTYFRQYVSSLPFHKFYQPDCATDLKKINSARSGAPHLFNQSFRLRTLEGLWHPDDERVQKASEQVDRLYLWVWRWLTQSQEFPLERVMDTLQMAMNFLSSAYRLTGEDRQMLCNALMWLGLFDPTSESRLRQVVQQLVVRSSSRSELLELEFLTIQFFIAKRDHKETRADDILKLLVQSPLWNSEDLLFKRLIDGVVGRDLKPDHLSQLVMRLREITHCLPAIKSRIVVDLVLCQFVDLEKGTKVVSEPLCLALNVLHLHRQLPCAEFVHLVFGLPQYDPFIHNGKIYNLLSRIRSLMGELLTIKVKAGFVICEGSWSSIAFRNHSDPNYALRFNPGWKKVMEGPSQEQLAGKGRSIELPETLTRATLQGVLNCPRSTANRILAQWQKEGRVTRRGSGRRIQYKTNPLMRTYEVNT